MMKLYIKEDITTKELMKLIALDNGLESYEVLRTNNGKPYFKNSNVYSKEKCKNCFAKFYCSGGCAANSYNFHGNINDAYDIGCDLQRKRIECAIMIKAALAFD